MSKKKRPKSKAALATEAARAARAAEASTEAEVTPPGADPDLQASEAARHEMAERAALPQHGAHDVEPIEFKGGGGLLTGMRGGFQNMVGGEKQKKKMSVVDIILWIAVLAFAGYVFGKKFGLLS